MSTVFAILDIFPHDCANFYVKHAPFINNIVGLGLTCHQDALSLIWILNKEGKLSVGELAKEIGVRKVEGVWRAYDPLMSRNTLSLAELESQGFEVADEREQYAEEPQFELPVGVITSTRELSDKLRVTMRRAQQIFADQVADLAAGNDLFGLEVAA
jgi:hypothetical protein